MVAGVVVGGRPAGAQEMPAAAFRQAFLEGKLSWDQVLDRARREGRLNWFHWGGSEELNTWIDLYVVPELQALGIELRTSRLPDTRSAVDLVLADAAAGRGPGEGEVDMIWLNGENFYALARQDMLFGPFADRLPNSKNFEYDADDPRATLNLTDFGVPNEKQELPWSGEQYVCYLDTGRLSQDAAPDDFAELEAWLRGNPGRFTYVRPPHYLGNTFVQTVLYGHNPEGAEPFQRSREDYTPAQFAALIAPGFDYLKRIEPFLLGGGGRDGARGAPIYPESDADNRALFANGEVDMGCEFGIYTSTIQRRQGAFPTTAEATIFPETGMIKNKNYLAIPLNAPHPAAALVFADLMASVEAQASKLETIGSPLGIDPWTLDEAAARLVAAASPPLYGVTLEALDGHAVPDTNASLVEIIEAVWIDYVAQQSMAPFEAIVQAAFDGRS